MALKKWNELPVTVRRSRKNLYNYLKSELEGESEDDSEETPSGRNISITVTDGTDPISGASVIIEGASATTGSAGGCTLRNVPDGDNSISVVAEGYDVITEIITVSEDSTSFTITLTPTEETPTVTFTVKDEENVAISGATVWCDQDHQDETDEFGCCEFELPDGEYAFSVAKEGYTEYADSLTVDGTSQTVEVVLTPQI